MNEQVTLASGESSLTQEIYIDSTLGDDTKLTFSYAVDIDVNVTTPNNNNYTVIKSEELKLITIRLHGEVVSKPAKMLVCAIAGKFCSEVGTKVRGHSYEVLSLSPKSKVRIKHEVHLNISFC